MKIFNKSFREKFPHFRAMFMLAKFRKFFFIVKCEKRRYGGVCSATAWNVAVLSPLLGVTWLFGVLAVSRQTTVVFQYVFAITNTLQVYSCYTPR